MSTVGLRRSDSDIGLIIVAFGVNQGTWEIDLLEDVTGNFLAQVSKILMTKTCWL